MYFYIDEIACLNGQIEQITKSNTSEISINNIPMETLCNPSMRAEITYTKNEGKYTKYATVEVGKLFISNIRFNHFIANVAFYLF